jgi:colanic acid/amylovoran biosynthesis protein
VKILVLWADAESANLGVRVLSEGSVLLAQRVWGREAEIITQDFTGAVSGVPLGGKSLLLNMIGLRKQVTRYLETFDVVLDTGAGDSFSDIYGLKRLLIMTHVQSLCKRLGASLILVPQTIGPFNSRVGRFLARRTLKSADVVATRDPRSFEVAENLGRVRIVDSSDLVFCLPVPAPAAEKTYDVLLNVSGLLWERNRHVDHESYRAHIANLITQLVSSGRSVTLFPHVLANASNDNDVRVLEQILKKVEVECAVAIPESLSDARDIVGSANLVIASRMHASLNALSVGTPSIAWAYSRKFAPLLEDVGWRHVVDLRLATDPVEQTIGWINDASLDLPAAAMSAAQRGRTKASRIADDLLVRV